MCDCVNIAMGSYDNQVELAAPDWSSKEIICVDRCLENEIVELWEKGVITGGCCCGHNKTDPMINVYPESIELMIRLGYEQQIIKSIPKNNFTFFPKSVKRIS